MPRRLQGLHAVRLQMTSIQPAELGDCILLRRLLPSFYERVAAASEHHLPGNQEIVHLESLS